MTLNDVILKAMARLKAVPIDNPQLDARLLVGHALSLDRAQLLSQSQRILTHDEIQAVEKLIARRAAHESVARIIGCREFWGLAFGLNEATLEPRPDSETVIEAALRLTTTPRRILDLGTGSGCLLLALLQEYPDATGLGIDIAPRAVAQAEDNARALGLGERAAFRVGHWLDGITETFDVIVSNPPYIPAADIPRLMPDVRDHDPLLALDGGTDGLEPYRFLIPRLAAYLNPNGLAAFEVGLGQAEEVADLFRQQGFANIATHRDLGGVARCVTAMKIPAPAL